ncbi:Membrane-associated guanylate kinase WW and PDZ domain-containing protein 2 [Taenia solium]
MPLISACVPEENQVKVISHLDQSSSWDSNIYDVLLSAASSEKSVPFPIDGGSDSGLFCTVGGTINPAQLIYHPIISSSTSPKRMPSILRPGDVILEIGEYQISGFTRLDAVRLCETLFHANSNGDRPRILLKLISPSALPTGSAQLHRFLSAQFQIGTPEFLLQEVTRNNIYQRVVPCTTREPRPEERDGVDYQFLGVERFLALEKSGQLLESGMYKGNHYGTPRPDANATALYVEARTKDGGDGDHSASESNGERSATSPELTCAAEESLRQQQQHKDLSSIALPNGWEVIDHPEYGLFYVDHIHQKTQYEPPTEADFEEAARFHAAKSSAPSITYTDNVSNNGSNGKNNHQKHQTSSSDTSDKSTDDAAQVRGPLVTAVLVKGSKGFGFTIVGGSSPGQPGFLQVKNVIPGGPAAQEGTLAVGNVLVSANGINVLGFSHDQIVTLFQSIPVGGTVTLTVSQGYSFVGAGAKKSQHQLTTMRSKPTVVERNVPFAPPDLCIRRLNTSPTISQLSGEAEEETTSTAVSRSGASAGAVVTAPVAVTKQNNGFGFTLADQVGGQRVKEVLEPTGLRVGDVILEVNGKWVKEASHLEVVQLLKTCPIGKTTNFLIQRVLPIPVDKKHAGASADSNFTIPLVKTATGKGARITVWRVVSHLLNALEDIWMMLVVRGWVSLHLYGGADLPPVMVSNPQHSSQSLLRTQSARGTPACLFRVSTLPDGADINAVSPISALYSTFHPADYNMIQSMTTSTSASTRYRSRTPGPGEESRRGMGAGTGAGLGSSSDCIYSLGESVNGLELYRCPSPPPNTTTTGANSGLGGNGGGAGAAVWTTGLKRYGGTDFDAYCLQQGLSRSNPFGSGQLLHLNSEYETLPRRTTIAPQIYGEFFVNLRHEANGFGFKLLGGSEEGTQVTIGQLAPGGAAERSTQMRAGDRLVSVNGTRVLGGSHAKALALLERTAEAHGEVTLGLWRPPPSLPPSASTSTSGSRSTESSKTRCWPSNAAAPAVLRSVLLQRASGEEGFGFVLANAPSKPNKSRRDGQVDTRSGDHFISRVVAGSASERSRLHVGDRLLSVNGVNVASLPREEVIRLVKASGPQLALTVLPCNVFTPSYEQMQFYNSQLYHHQQQQLHQQQKERAVFFHVTLFRSSRGFGFSIRGGHEFNQMPLTVLRVAEGGPAHLDGRLKVGDELLQINGFMTAGMSHRRAVEIIQAGGNMIRLGVRRSLLSSGEVKNLAAPSQLSPSPLSFASFGPLPPTLSAGPMAPQPLPVPPPPPPNLLTPQFFTPIPVHKSSIGSRPLLSSVKSPQRQRSLITYQSLPRLWQKHHDGTGTHSSSHHDLEAWASGDRGCYGTQVASDRYHPYRGTERKKPILQYEYSQRYTTTPKRKDRNPGIIATILPFYAFGIFVYFVYTIIKLLNKRRKVNPGRKEEHLTDYYRNFRYVPEREKFKMDSDSSENERGNGSPCKVGWSLASKCSNGTPDVYRSVADLPKDLEYLLKKADQDNLGKQKHDVEITRLRTHLEQMETEMTRLLEAVNSSAIFLAQTRNVRSESRTTEAQCTDAHSDDSETLFSAEEN